MPDPYGRYANLMARHPHLKSTTVNPPNIRDRNGALILPSDYSLKLGNQTPVFVTVKLRLWVLSSLYVLLLLKVPGPARWEISPQSEEKRATSGFKSRDGEENGSRIYQLLLHEMSLLPSNVPASNRIPSKIVNQDATIEDPNGTMPVGTEPGIDRGKGKKCVLASIDSDDGDVGMCKKIRQVVEDADIEIADQASA